MTTRSGILPIHPVPTAAILGSDLTEYNLLLASEGITRFVGREVELAELSQWLQAPAPLDCRLILGSAGVGKTRLGYELLRAAPPEWITGLVWPQDLRSIPAFELPLAHAWNRPHLLMVDYASECGGALGRWVAEISKVRPIDSARLRILLLDRSAREDQGWFQEFRSVWFRGSSQLAGCPLPSLPITPLVGFGDVDLRSSLFVAARAAAEALCHRKAVYSLDLQEVRATILEAGWTEPLTLMMAGLLSTVVRLSDFRGMSPADLATQIAKREADRISRYARERGDPTAARLMTQVAARCTVCGGIAAEQAQEFTAQTAKQLGPGYQTAVSSAWIKLSQALPGPEGGIAALRPDLPGEAFVLRELFGPTAPSDEVALAALEHCRTANIGALSFWIRMIHDFSNPAEPDGKHSKRSKLALDRLIEMSEREPTRNRANLSQFLTFALPSKSVALTDAALVWNAWLVDDLRVQTIAGDASDESRYPIALANFAFWLGAAGRREDALRHAEEASRVLRQLARWQPDKFQHLLALSLNNMGNMLSDVRPGDDAVAFAEEAVSINRRLAEGRPDQHLPHLARSLDSLGGTLADCGRCESALEVMQEAVNHFRSLSKSLPAAFLPDLARSLNNVSAVLSRLGRRETAVTAAEEAVTIRRQLSHSSPDAYLPDLAMSLTNFGSALMNCGMLDRTLATAEEAREIYLQLCDHLPTAFSPEMAGLLNNLANLYSELGRQDKALAMAERAVKTYRELSKRYPRAFLLGLSTSLDSLGAILLNSGRPKDALSAAEEAVAIQRLLSRDRPGELRSELAKSLQNLGLALLELKRPREALDVTEESMSMYRYLAAGQPGSFLPEVAGIQTNLGVMLAALGRREAALASLEQAVTTFRRLSDCPSFDFRRNLATTCLVRGEILDSIGRSRAAIKSFSEGLQALSQPLAVLPSVFLQLAGTLAREYLETCKQGRVVPDSELLQPVFTAMQRVEQDPGGDGKDV